MHNIQYEMHKIQRRAPVHCLVKAFKPIVLDFPQIYGQRYKFFFISLTLSSSMGRFHGISFVKGQTVLTSIWESLRFIKNLNAKEEYQI